MRSYHVSARRYMGDTLFTRTRLDYIDRLRLHRGHSRDVNNVIWRYIQTSNFIGRFTIIAQYHLYLRSLGYHKHFDYL